MEYSSTWLDANLTALWLQRLSISASASVCAVCIQVCVMQEGVVDEDSRGTILIKDKLRIPGNMVRSSCTVLVRLVLLNVYQSFSQRSVIFKRNLKCRAFTCIVGFTSAHGYECRMWDVQLTRPCLRKAASNFQKQECYHFLKHDCDLSMHLACELDISDPA